MKYNRQSFDSETLGVIGILIVMCSRIFVFLGIRKEMYAWIGVTLFVLGIAIALCAINNRNKY